MPALIKYANNNYRPQMIHEMEIMVLNRLGWCLTVVTPLHFLGYLLTKGAVFTTDRMGNRPCTLWCCQPLCHLLLRRCLRGIRMCFYWQ